MQRETQAEDELGKGDKGLDSFGPFGEVPYSVLIVVARYANIIITVLIDGAVQVAVVVIVVFPVEVSIDISIHIHIHIQILILDSHFIPTRLFSPLFRLSHILGNQR
ncbi:hypothetical protein NW755_014552 [Fusarium falciforme]|uniref:Uncharacterized protein n=1 Tax=Fusarium falciforme TaxID=195108 RepID=A0A9W8QTZ2_9HYPO|nr:hypothetical protein NW755_014552 [Fusarium falciforme]